MSIRRMMALTLSLAALSGPVATRAQTTVAANAGQERIVGLPCEGCEAVFVRMPPSPGSSARIAAASERGEPLQLRGRVVDTHGVPIAGVIVYAYHTNSAGIYPSDAALKGAAAAPHGRLRGWARSNERGEYEFETIRPGPYPGRPDPQHIHMHVIEVGRCTYYIGNVEFTDDPRLTAEQRARAGLLRGGSGVTTPVRDDHGVWQVRRDIHLGKSISDYSSCDPEH